MSAMLAKSTPRHCGQFCRMSGRGCTCFYYDPSALTNGQRRGKERRRERRLARAIEKRNWRREAVG